MTVEHVSKVPGMEWLNCIVVRLDDHLGDVGDILVRVTYHGFPATGCASGLATQAVDYPTTPAPYQPRDARPNKA